MRKKTHVYLYCDVIIDEAEVVLCELNGQTQILLGHFSSSGLKVLMSKFEVKKCLHHKNLFKRGRGTEPGRKV